MDGPTTSPSELLEFVMWMLDRLQKGKFMFESQSAVHRSVPLHAKPVKKDGHLRALNLVTPRSSTANLTTVIQLSWMKMNNINLSHRRSQHYFFSPFQFFFSVFFPGSI